MLEGREAEHEFSLVDNPGISCLPALFLDTIGQYYSLSCSFHPAAVSQFTDRARQIRITGKSAQCSELSGFLPLCTSSYA